MTLAWTASAPVRVTCYAADGTPTVRWTLQVQDREGRVLSWPVEAAVRTKGAAQNFQRSVVLHGFRPQLDLKWGVDASSSTREVWSGSAWGAGVAASTAQAVEEIVSAAGAHAVTVEPFSGSTWPSWTAKAFDFTTTLKDLKGVVHTRLALRLAAETLRGGIRFKRTGWGHGAWGHAPWGT